MQDANHALESAREELRLAHAAGRPYLLIAGVWLLALALAAPELRMRTLGLWAMLHALLTPLLAGLYARWRLPAPSPANPLLALARRIGLIPLLALPAALLAFSWYPIYVPAIYAAVCGAHLLPWGWLYRSRVYLLLALVVSLPPLPLALNMRERSIPWLLGVWGGAYLLGAAWLWLSERRRHAAA